PYVAGANAGKPQEENHVRERREIPQAIGTCESDALVRALICTSEELAQKRKVAATVNNRPVVVVLSLDGNVYALRDICPHRGPRLSDGMIDTGCSGNSVGEYIFDEKREYLR